MLNDLLKEIEQDTSIDYSKKQWEVYQEKKFLEEYGKKDEEPEEEY